MAGFETQLVEAVERLISSGKIVEIGDEIEVAVHDAERLIANGAAKPKGAVKASLKTIVARAKAKSGDGDSDSDK